LYIIMNAVQQAKAKAKADAVCAKTAARMLAAKAAAYAKAGLPQQRYVVDYVPVDVNGNRAPPVHGGQEPGPVEGVQPREAQNPPPDPVRQSRAKARAVAKAAPPGPPNDLQINLDTLHIAHDVAKASTRGIKRLLDDPMRLSRSSAPTVAVALADIMDQMDVQVDASIDILSQS